MSNLCNQLLHAKHGELDFSQLADLGILVVSNDPSEDGP
jgi:hypothetical protein